MSGTEIAWKSVVNYFNYLILTSVPWETTLKIDALGKGEGWPHRQFSNISRKIGLIKLSNIYKPRKIGLIKLSIIPGSHFACSSPSTPYYSYDLIECTMKEVDLVP